MPRRWIRLICFAISIASLIFGCQKIYLDGADSNHSVTLRLSGWDASPTEQRLLQQVLDDFVASHPHISVKLESIADQYMDVIKTRLIGDAAPDVFYLDSIEAPFLMTQNVLESLNTYIQPDSEIDDFEENLLNTFVISGKLLWQEMGFLTNNFSPWFK
ncbi:MAG TPA: extracellular solute-binding protein [Trichocoleus sp.]|jgi:multiple sugar transport system substrate-binding protein